MSSRVHAVIAGLEFYSQGRFIALRTKYPCGESHPVAMPEITL
jgi:hypothetical protein